MIKTTEELLKELNNYANPNSKIARMVKENRLFKLKNGIYETEKDISSFYLTDILYGPSYVSFQSALYYYGMIPECTKEITCATKDKHKTKRYDNCFGSYTYRDIPSQVYDSDVNDFNEKGYRYFIATKEKALCDMIYEYSPFSSVKELEKMLFDELKINKEEFKRCDKKKLIKLSEMYHTTNHKLFISFIKNYEKENGGAAMLKEYGFLRVGAAVNELHLCDTIYNTEKVKELVREADNKGVEILAFPELTLCGYTCQDQFLNDDLYHGCRKGLQELKEFSKETKTVFIVGSPLRIGNSLYNCAFSFSNGHIIGITPKTYIPNYNEFYEARWFTSGKDLKCDTVTLFGEEIKISNTLLYKCENYDITYAIDICEDLWLPQAPSDFTTKNGATIIFNLSASNETVGKANYRRSLVRTQAGKTLSAYVYASAGLNESSSDILFGGHAMIAEPDGTFTENNRFSFESSIIMQDIDFLRIKNDRLKERSFTMNFTDVKSDTVCFTLPERQNVLLRHYEKKPFLAHTKEGLEEILNIQSYALARRVRHLGNAKMVIGISGGADSTLAFLICMRVTDILNIPKKNVIAITMPGFGTSGRTYNNSKTLITESGADFREISIKDACTLHYKDIGHKDGVYDITYENVQARERTQILFDVANQENGIVIGTGDMSELALGWATYNGDHMSNYGVNCSVPKTLVTTLIGFIRDESTGKIKETLTDILNTPISPELLPIDKDGNIQNTEKSVGPYILNDFFLYHFLRYGASLKKIYFLACRTFQEDYSEEEIKAVLTVFVKRFFTQQFKRNCVPDGIKIGSVAVSPRGDLRMPADTFNRMYLEELKNL